ncbi:hypothetical protein BGX33_001922, partial [Mortierella sp. NVP41]
LGTILKYCQTESGFTVGISDTTGVINKLQEFSGVVDKKSGFSITPTGSKSHVIETINMFLQFL